MMKKHCLSAAARVLGAAAFLLALATPALPAAQPGPMQRAASDLGTPKLGYTARNDAHSNSLFEFVPARETVDTWTKLFTVIATSVAPERTPAETLATIGRYHRVLLRKGVALRTYEVRGGSTPMAYFAYTIGNERDAGVVFSPFPGVVTVQQVAARRGGVISAHDIGVVKALAGFPR